MANSIFSNPACTVLFSLMTILPCNGQVNTDSSFRNGAIGIKYAKLAKTLSPNDAGENVHCALKDRNGNLWFGTTGHGVFYYDGKSFTKFTVVDGLNSNNVWTIAEDGKGNIWLGTDNGVTLFDGKYFTDFTKWQTFGQQAICYLFKDKTGKMWISTIEKGTHYYDGKYFTNLTSVAGIINESKLTLSHLNGIAEDKAGNLWFASWPPYPEGLARFDGKTIKECTEKDGLVERLFHSVIVDKSGIVWVGSRDHGVFRYKGNFFTHVTNLSGPGNNCIYSILEDSRGNIWFTTESNGVFRYDGTSFKNYTTKDGLINNSVFSVVEDKAGNLWFGTRNVGLCRYDGKSFVNYSE